jgi:hypothetical protein
MKIEVKEPSKTVLVTVEMDEHDLVAFIKTLLICKSVNKYYASYVLTFKCSGEPSERQRQIYNWLSESRKETSKEEG